MSREDAPIVFGEVLFDCFEDGSRVLGGAPFNVAWHLQAFGLRPRLVSRVGDDAAGREVLAAMRAWGMDVEGVEVDARRGTGEVRVRVESGEPRFEIAPGQAFDFIEAGAVAPRGAGLLYHGSLALRSDAAGAGLDRLRASRPETPVFVDVNLRAPWWQPDAVAARVRDACWVKLNEHELAELSDAHDGPPVIGGRPLEARARAFVERFDLRLLIVTRGPRGALAVTAQGERFEVRPRDTGTVVDTVGAGDAFSAVCIVGLLARWPVARMLERAQQFASKVVAYRGATQNDRGPYTALATLWQDGA